MPVPDPLPVGTKVGLKIDDRTLEGRVISVAESTDSAKCGMKIRIGGAARPRPPRQRAAPRQRSGADAEARSCRCRGGRAHQPAAPADAAVAAEGGADVSALTPTVPVTVRRAPRRAAASPAARAGAAVGDVAAER